MTWQARSALLSLLFEPTETPSPEATTETRAAREAAGVARTAAAVAPGTLPHEAPAGGWKVWDTTKFNMQPAWPCAV